MSTQPKTNYDGYIALLLVGLLVWSAMGKSGGGIISPSTGPRFVVVITESANATPSRDAMLAELRNTADWGKSKYRWFENDQDQAKAFTEKHPGDGLHIGTMTDDGKFSDFLFSGELPKSTAEVVAAWKEHGGE